MKRILTTFICTLFFIGLFSAGAFAQTVSIVHDSGSGERYNALPANYAQLTNLNVGDAVIESGSGYIIQNTYNIGSNSPTLLWRGKLHFGGQVMTNSTDASLRTNTLPDVTLRFRNGARLYDGSYCDVKLTFSDIQYAVSRSQVSSINDNTTVMVPLMRGWGGLVCNSPGTSFARGSSGANGRNACATSCTRYKVTIQLVKRDTNTPISASDYPMMLIMVKDLDVFDGSIRKSANATLRTNGRYAESVEFVSGVSGNVVLAPQSSDLANTCLVNTVTTNGNTRVKPYGNMLERYAERFKSDVGDIGSLYSGFVTAVSPQGFSFYWTGSINHGLTDDASRLMGTTIGEQPTVAVKAMRNGPGASASSLTSSSGGRSNVENWATNIHLYHSSPKYTATPGTGHFLSNLRVDGVDIALTAAEKKQGKSYTFSLIGKNPLERRDSRTGATIEDQHGDSKSYSIEATFKPYPAYKAEKSVDKKSVKLDDDRKLYYRIIITETKNDVPEGVHKIHDDLANGLLEVDPSSIRIAAEHGTATYTLGENGLDITFNSNAALGITPKAVIDYAADVDWDNYKSSPADKIINTASGQNEGGGRTGNSTSVDVTTDLIVKNTVAGKLRDTTKKFEIEVSLKGLEKNTDYEAHSISGGEIVSASDGPVLPTGFKTSSGGEATVLFKLKDGQGIELNDLPIGATYTFREASSDHVASYKITSTGSGPVIVKAEDANLFSKKELATKAETVDKTDGVVTVTYKNVRNPVGVTGILVHYDWTIIATAAIVACIILRRKGLWDSLKSRIKN